MRRAGAAALATARAHPRHVVLSSVVAGMLAAVWAPAALPAVAVAVAGLAGRRGLALTAIIGLLVAAAAADARRDAIDGGVLPARYGDLVDLEVVAVETTRARSSGQRVMRARVTSESPAHGETVLLRLPPERPHAASPPPADVGAVLRVSGRLQRLEPFERLQQRRGALAAIDVHDSDATGARRGGLSGALDGIRMRAERALAAGQPQPRAAIVAGMVLGRDEQVTAEARAYWQRSGLAHLLAASGSNVMLLATLVLGAGALVGAPLRWRLGGALVLVAVYVPVAGAGPSIQRAGIMGAAGLVAALAGRPQSRWYALGFAAAATQLINPYAAGEPGWQLSFAAVVGLLAWAGGLRDRLRGRGVPLPAAEVIALTVAASIATAPLMALHFGEISLVTVVANLAAAPAVAPVMWLGTLAAALGQLGIVTPLSALAGLGAAYVDDVARLTGSLPNATVAVDLGPVGVTAVGVTLVAAWAAWRRREGVRAGWRRRRAASLTAVERPHLRAAGEPVQLWVAATAALAAVAILVGPTLKGRGGPGPPAPGETRVSFLDVGQGDATLVERDGAALLVDTGPRDGPVVAEVRRAGVDRLDALVITHAQADHEGAALAVIERLRPRVVVNGGVGWPSPVQGGLARVASEAGSRVVTASANDVITVGALEMRFMWPPVGLMRAPPEGDPNDRALVAHLRSGAFDLLLPADAESPVTTRLRLPQVEALKVAHHGSDDELLPVLLDRVRPAVAAIEVGRGNPYGHPAPSTLEALRRVPEVRRTDVDGTVRLRVDGAGRMHIETDGAVR